MCFEDAKLPENVEHIAHKALAKLKKFKTAVMPMTLNPEWNETFSCEVNVARYSVT